MKQAVRRYCDKENEIQSAREDVVQEEEWL